MRCIGGATAAIAALALMAGCGERPEPQPEGGPSAAARGEVLLEVFTSGGYVPEIDALREYPELVLYGDGRLVTPAEAPGLDAPAVPALEVRRLSEQQVATVLEAAADAGLDDPLDDYGHPEITDLGTTTFTLRTADGLRQASVYALGHPLEGFDLASAARERLLALAQELDDPEELLGDDAPQPEPFDPDAWLVGSVDDPDACRLVEGRRPRVPANRRDEVAIRPAIGLEDECPKGNEMAG